MTLDTEATLTATAQEVAVHRAVVGIMAGQAVHRLTIARIEGIFADRVGEALMLLVAFCTNIVAIFQHRHTIGAVQLMAVGTEIPATMHVQILFTPFEGICVAIATDAADVSWQQPRKVTDMRVVTADARIPVTGDPQMVVDLIERFECLAMALQADSNTHLPAVADLAITLGKRLMADTPQQGATLPAMRMMTGETIDLA